jgi:DNA-binding beta-propeller fold protein YncE
MTFTRRQGPLSRLFLSAASLIAALAFAQAASASPCPGADSCPWTQVDVFGDVGNDEFRAPYGIGADGSGNLYVLEQDVQRVKKLDANGGFLAKWGGQGSAEGKLSIPTDIAVDAASGGVYVTDSDNNRVQRFDTGGNFVAAWGWGVADGSAAYQVCTSNCRAGSQGSGPGQFNAPLGIATDGVNVYVVDGFNDRIQKFTLAGAHVGGWTMPGGQTPERVTVAGGKVYVSTRSNTVWRFDTNGAVDTGWDGDGVLGSSGTGAGQFDFPEGVAVDGSGVYVADGDNNRVQKFDLSGGFTTMWGWGVADGADALQTCSANCQAGKLGSGEGQFFEPYGVLATGGAVWVADAYNHRLQRFGQAGAHQLTVGAPPGAGDYYFPTDVATAASGHAYVADRSAHDIQELDGSGHSILRWSTGLSVPFSVTPTANGVYAPEGINHVSLYDSTGGLLSQFGSTGSGQGQLSFPTGSAADAQGNLYVAERFNNRVQKFDPAGVPLAVFGSFGSGEGQLKAPQDVAVDSAGNVYVADSGNHRIEKFSPTGEFLSKFGSFGKGDGQFDSPEGVAVDSTGHVFVSDAFNNRIQEFDANGDFVAKWGTLGGAPGELSDPAGLAVDSSGAVWVADSGNHRIVRFSFTDANEGTSPGSGEPQPAPGGTTGDAGSPVAGPGVDTAAPRIRLRGRSTQRSRLVARRGLALRVSASERVKVTLRAILSRRDARRLGLHARSVGRSSAELTAAGTGGLRLRLTARSRRALLRVQRVRLVVRATATDPTGNRSSDSFAITVTR